LEAGAAGGSLGPLPVPQAEAGAALSAPDGTEVSKFQVGALTGKGRDSMRILFGLVGVTGALLLSTSALWRTKGVHATWLTS
jgi:hypothetical protein